MVNKCGIPLLIKLLLHCLLSRPNFKALATIGDRTFIAAAPKLWNTLPLTIRNIDNFNLFKNKLKTFLFRQALNDFKCLN